MSQSQEIYNLYINFESQNFEKAESSLSPPSNESPAIVIQKVLGEKTVNKRSECTFVPTICTSSGFLARCPLASHYIYIKLTKIVQNHIVYSFHADLVDIVNLDSPPIHLYLIFEISSLKNPVRRTRFLLPV